MLVVLDIGISLGFHIFIVLSGLFKTTNYYKFDFNFLYHLRVQSKPLSHKMYHLVVLNFCITLWFQTFIVLSGFSHL